MANLFDYLKWRGDITFEQVPFSKLDALLLSHLSYSIFDGLLSESFDEKKTLEQLALDFKNAKDYENRINIGFLINKQTVELMFACAKSERFKNVQICGYKKIDDLKIKEQFAAMVYLAGGKTVISYRGTDDTINGWWEDFNLVYLPQIPAQKDAIEYMKAAADYFKGDFTLVGHSKGGNLVVNTAVEVDQNIQNRIEKIYNFDGPGFKKEFFERPEFKAVENKLFSVYPEFSVVGMIFNHTGKYQVAKSDGFAVMQHDAMTWQVMGADFDEAPDFTPESKFFAKTFNEWLEGLTADQTEVFINAFYEVVQACGATTLNEIEDNPLHSAAKMVQQLSAMDKKRKREVHRMLRMFKTVIRKDSPFAKVLTLARKQV